MKKKLNYLSIAAIGLIVTACGGGQTEENKDLAQLKSKRDSLKHELTLVNQQIQELDTTIEVLNPLVSVEPIEIKDFYHKVEVQGSVETDQNALVNAEASGVIRVIHVKEGQKVSKGQALLTIDSQILQSTIEEVEVQLEMAEYMLEKQEKLMEEGVGVEIEYEQAKSNKEALEKKLKTMKSQKGKTIVNAPFSGVVDEIMVNVGEMAAPQFPLLRIVNNREVSISASMSENLLAHVNEGTPVELVIPSLNDTVIISKVTYKGNFIDPVNRTFKIRIDIKNNTLLLPNQLAKVNVTDFIQKDAMVVNSESVLQDTENNSYVYKLDQKDGDVYTIQKVFVQVVKRYNGEASVKAVNAGELTENDRIVVRGAKGITESDQVKLL